MPIISPDDKKKLYKRRIDKTNFMSLYKRADIDSLYGMMSNLISTSDIIKKMGGVKNFSLLYKDHDIYSVIDKRIAALMTSKLSFEGPDESLNQFFADQILPHERQLKQDFWWTIFNGYGVEQIIYNEDMSGRVVGFQKEDFWRFQPLEDLIHVKLVNGTNMELINKIMPYGKWVLTTNNGTSNNPYGDAMAERLVTPWMIKCLGWDLWVDFGKRLANGFMHAKIEDGNEASNVFKMLETSGKSGILVTDKTSEFNIIQGNKDSTIYQALDDRTVRAIQKVVLGETQTSDMQERGSSGSAGIQNEVRQEKTWADIDMVEKAINETVRQIGDANGFDPRLLPKAVLSWEPDFSLQQSARDQALHSMGIRFNKEYYQKTYGIDVEDFELADVDAPQIPSFGFSQKGKKSFLSKSDMAHYLGLNENQNHVCPIHMDARTNRIAKRQEDENEEIVSLVDRNANPPLNTQDLFYAILNSENNAQLEKNLNALFDNRNNQFVDDMTKALYLSAARGALVGNPEVLKDEEE